MRDCLESGLLIEADARKIRAEELNPGGVADNAKTARTQAAIKDLSGEINSEFAGISNRVEKDRVKSAIEAARIKWSEYARALSDEILPALQKGGNGQARVLSTGVQENRFGKLAGQIADMNRVLKAEISGAEEATNALVGKKVTTALVLSGVVILAVMFLVWRILAGISRHFRDEADYARSVADGDLTGKVLVETEDEMGDLGESLNSITESFRSLLDRNRAASKELTRISRTIAETSKRVINASENKARRINETSAAIMEINASVKGVAQGVDSLSLSASENSSSILEMAASVEEVALNVENLAQTVEDVSSSIVEMAASIKQIGNSVHNLIEASSVTASSVMEMDSAIHQVEKNAMDTSLISEEVRRDAETGRASVEATIRGMQEIKRSSGITSEVIVTLSEKANDIGTILSVIDEVAEQTNLLALNAAIIAAQAGDQGKGFAVVADEIKELADRTSSSTREIALLIKGVQEETRRAVEAINQAEKSIADGEQLSQKSGEALNKIVEGVKKATEQIAEIARATVEQATGSQMIRDAVEQVTDMIMQISNATKEQGKGSDLIMTAVERMKVLTGQVRSSTREQSKVGSFIAQSTENITSMIQQIKRACDEQARGSEQIVQAVEDIQRSTDESLEAVTVLDDAYVGLSRQVETLEKEARRFRTDG
jgi:methyl-accepting chemotaxis protein